jgi:DNA topoisomerase-1
MLPPLTQGQPLSLIDIAEDKKTTQPPPRYNDASLVRELEEKGIGRPSTYAAILDTIQKRGYAEKRERRFFPSELGLAVSDLLVEGFPDNIMDAGFTARMEDELDEVEEGNRSYQQTLRDFWDPFARALAEAEHNLAAVKGGIATGIACPRCGKPVLIRFSFRAGAFAGSFLGCSAYPGCPFTSNLARDERGGVRIAEKPPQEVREERCPQCQAQMMTAAGRFGRYLRCSAPDCKGTRPYPTGVACPLPGCGGNLVEKRSRFGFWYPCDNYPSCTYSVRNMPVARPCPSCAFPLRTRREGKRGVSLTCPRCRERMMEESPEAPAAGDAGEG